MTTSQDSRWASARAVRLPEAWNVVHIATITTEIPELKVSDRFADYEFWPFIGTALGTQAWSSTHVSGGAVTTSQHGHVSSTPITSTTTNHTRFFVRAADGREKEIELVDGFGVRDGQHIAIIYGGKKNKKSGKALICYNISTNKYYEWKNTKKLCGFYSFFDNILLIIISIFISYILYERLGMMAIGIGILFCAVVYFFVLAPPKNRRHKLLIERLCAVAVNGADTGYSFRADSALQNSNTAAPIIPHYGDKRRNDLCSCGSGRKFKHCHGKIHS